MTTKHTLYMPANGTEGEIFDAEWCAHCAHDAPFREDIEWNDGCEILAAGLRGEQPAEWIERGGVPACTAFLGEGVEPRCLLTLEMFP